MHLRSPLTIIDQKLKDIEKKAPAAFLENLKAFSEKIADTKNANEIEELKRARAQYIIDNLSSFENIKKEIASIIDELGMVDVRQIAFDGRQFNVVRRNHEAMADYIKRIHQQAKALEKKQQEIEDYILKLRKYFEYLCDAASDAFEVSKNIKLKLPPLWQQRSAKSYQALYEKCVSVYNDCADKIDELKAQAKDELLKLAAMKDNTIVVYVWYLKGVTPGSRKMFGLDSTGHVAIGMKKPDEEPVYISLYPDKDPNAQVSFLGTMAKRFGLPSPDTSKGYFASLEEDLFRRYVTNDKLSYGTLAQIEISCEPGSQLDIDAAITAAKGMLANTTEYSFYNKNCSTVVMKLLTEAKCPEILPLPSHHATLPDSPGEVVSYAEDLKIKQIEDQMTTALADYSNFHKRVIKRIALAKAKLEKELYLVEKNHGIYNSKSADEKNHVKSALNLAIQKITALEADVKNAKTNEALNDLLKTKISSDLSIISDGQKEFPKRIINTVINPTLGALKVLLPIDAKQKMTQIMTVAIGNIETSIHKLTGKPFDKNGLISKYLERQHRILSNLSLGKVVNDSLDKPRNSSLIIANKINNMISQVPYEIDEIINTSHTIYLTRLSNLIDMLRTTWGESAQLATLHEELQNTKLDSQTVAKKLNDYYLTLVPVDSDAIKNNQDEFYKLLDGILGYKLDVEHIPQLHVFKNAYISHLQDAFGAFNQYLYFDAHASYLENNEDNILNRLKKALNVKREDADGNDTSVIIQDAVKLFKIAQPTNDIDIASNSLHEILHNPDETLTYNETLNKIGKIIQNAKKWKFNILSRNQLDELHYQALITATIQAFKLGRLTTRSFIIALKAATKVTHLKHKKQMIDRILESFELQIYLDDVEPKSETKNTRTIKHFKYIDIEHPSNRMISKDNAMTFYDALQPHTNAAHLLESSYRFIMQSMQSMFSHPLYSIVMQSHYHIGVPEFNHAIGMGFHREGKDQANQLLASTYNRIITKCAKIPNSLQLNADTLTDGEKLFCDVYNYMATLSDILKNNYAISESENKLKSIQILTKDGDFFHAKLGMFIEHIHATVKVHQLQKWLVVEPMMTHVTNLELNLKKANLEYLFTSTEQDPEPKDTKSAPSTHADAINILSSTATMMQRHLEQLCQSKHPKGCLKQVHQNLKNQLEAVTHIHIDALPQNTQTTIHKAKLLFKDQLTQTMGSLNRFIYLEDTTMKKCLAKFLEIPNYSHKSIHRILTEASTAAKEEASRFGCTDRQKYYKNILIQLLRNFIDGKLDEVAFHHQLSSFIEDHQPDYKLPGLHWMFAIFYRGEDAHKYSEMPNLIYFKNKFMDKFIDSEVQRGKTELTISSDSEDSQKESVVIKEGKMEIPDHVLYGQSPPTTIKKSNHQILASVIDKQPLVALNKKEHSRLKRLKTKIQGILSRLPTKSLTKPSENMRQALEQHHYEKRSEEIAHLLDNNKHVNYTLGP